MPGYGRHNDAGPVQEQEPSGAHRTATDIGRTFMATFKKPKGLGMGLEVLLGPATGGVNSTAGLAVTGVDELTGLPEYRNGGLLLDTGSAVSSTQFWDRRSTVSLTHRALGELRAGRDFIPSYSNWSRYDPFGYVGVAGSNNLVSAAQNGPTRGAFSTSPNTTVRSSNALQWLLPQGWAGLEGGLMVAAGEGGAAANGQHKVIGARLGWANKQFGVSAATTRTENNLTLAAGAGRFEDHAIGASADFGVVRMSLAYRVFDHASAKQKNTLVGLWVPVGNGELKASFVQADLDGSAGTTAIGANIVSMAAAAVHLAEQIFENDVIKDVLRKKP